MGRAQLKALLKAGASSIAFDAREAPDSKLAPFFDHPLLKNVMLLKTVVGAKDGTGLQTRLYIPFDARQVGNGGKSLLFAGDVSRGALETFFGVTKLDDPRIDGDLQKLAILAKTPSFSPFLLRDAFERAGLKIDARYFGVTDEEASALRENLKAKLKPLAALALQLSPTAVGDSRLDLLARKLWELDDERFILPLARALKLNEGEAAEVLYGWIGVSFFQREFAKRQTKLRLLAEWLSRPLFADGLNDELVRQCETDRKQVRDRLRWAWSTAGTIFDRYNASYNALIGQGDARPFVDYLQTARADFQGLGIRLSVIEQCLCLYDVSVGQDRGSQLGFEIMQDVARSMREAPVDGAAGLAA